MKKAVLFATVLLMICCICTSCKEKSGFTYEKVDGGISITGYTGEGENVVIPEKIDNKTVVSISRSAFEAKKIVSIYIPDSVKEIQRYAFRRCINLTQVKLPQGIKEIQSGVFNFCTALQTIEIPDSVEYIGENSFGGTSISEVILPDSVKTIDDYAYCNCVYLEKFTCGKDLSKLGLSAFASCISLSDITFNEGLTEIGENCFDACSSLKQIDLPLNLEKISINAFKHTSLVNVTIPLKVKIIDSMAFEGCVSLRDIYIPETVEKINIDAFKGCKGVVIHGVQDSQAEIYADENGFKFEKYEFN